MMITDMNELKERLMLYFKERYNIVTKLKFNRSEETMNYHNTMLKITTMTEVITPDYEGEEVTMLIVFVGGDAGITVPKFVLNQNEDNLYTKIKHYVLKEYIAYLTTHVNYLDKCFVKEIEKCAEELSVIEPNSSEIEIKLNQYDTDCIRDNILMLHEKFSTYIDELKDTFPNNVIVETLSPTPFSNILELLDGSYTVADSDEKFFCMGKENSSYIKFSVPKFLCTDMNILNNLAYMFFKEVVLYQGIKQWGSYLLEYTEMNNYIDELKKYLCTEE